MTEALSLIIKDIAHNEPIAVVDDFESDIQILTSDMKTVSHLLKRKGAKNEPPHKNELYLYGMSPFVYLYKDGENITLCEQLACRSTLNGGWVPLDRKINLTALQNAQIRENGIPYVCAEDTFCYLLAKSVYTDKSFERTKNRLIESLAQSDNTKVMEKLSGVFFKFSPVILELCKKQQFDSIIPAVWTFSEY